MEATAHAMEDLIRRMTPVAAPPEQQAQVAALSKALEDMAHQRESARPSASGLGRRGENIPLPESVIYVSSASLKSWRAATRSRWCLSAVR